MFEQREWKAREVQYPGKRILTDTATGEMSSVLVTRDEGTVTEMGDSFSAANMNDFEGRIASGIHDAAGSFSETEIATGATWFDGKPIYRISKYYSDVTFAGTGQWTDVGASPIDLTDSLYNVLNVDMQLFYASLTSELRNTCSAKLPLVYNGGTLSTPNYWDGKFTFNWANSVTAPFTTTDVLVTVYYTKNE